jgi:site-specific recombinase XerD
MAEFSGMHALEYVRSRVADHPSPETLEGLRDRAILLVGLQVGLRRAEIAALVVGDLHQNRGYDSLRVTRKGGRRDALTIMPTQRSASEPILRPRSMRTTSKGRCSARFATTAKTSRTSRAFYINEREQHAIVWKRPDKKFEITI